MSLSNLQELSGPFERRQFSSFGPSKLGSQFDGLYLLSLVLDLEFLVPFLSDNAKAASNVLPHMIPT